MWLSVSKDLSSVLTRQYASMLNATMSVSTRRTISVSTRMMVHVTVLVIHSTTDHQSVDLPSSTKGLHRTDYPDRSRHGDCTLPCLPFWVGTTERSTACLLILWFCHHSLQDFTLREEIKRFEKERVLKLCASGILAPVTELGNLFERRHRRTTAAPRNKK